MMSFSSVEFGTYALCLALILSLGQSLVVALGLLPLAKASGLKPLARMSEALSVAGAGCCLLAFLILIHAFVVSDFSVANVAQNSHTLKPLLYKIAGAWASHEGSMLLWCTILLAYGALVALWGKNLPDHLKHKVLMVQGLIGALFLAFTLLSSNPLARLDHPPLEGQSLNPLLQDPALAFHPPMLYLGYVGFSVVFSFAIAALIEGRIDRAFARWVRPWTLLAWCFLTLGITLGAFWAYYELGWGGWWFWDPVENASFMPWLAGTALLHSAIVMEKRDALKSWTVFLSLLAFCFAMMGAFLVRSGVLTSVHAFAVDPKRGFILLMILGLLSSLGFGLYAWRVPQFKAGGLFAPISREAALVVNNILLSAALGSVCLGTLFPLLMEALSGASISVGAPYFLLTFTPIMVAAVLILPFAIQMSWKRADLVAIGQRLILIAVISLGLGLVFGFWGEVRGLMPKLSLGLGVALGAWLILASLQSVISRLSIGSLGVWRRLKGLPLAFLGMNLAHLGLGLFILGATYETQAKQSKVEALEVGQSLSLRGQTLTLKGVGALKGPNYQAVAAQIEVRDGRNQLVCAPTPERRFYPASKQTTSEVALCLTPLSDLYLVLGEAHLSDDGKRLWQVRVLWNPWVRLIFLGPLLMLLGGILSLCDRHLRFGPVKKAPEKKAIDKNASPQSLGSGS